MIAVCALAAALLTGCSVKVEYDYDYLVTFDYNVDKLGVATNCETQYIGIDDGKKLIRPGSQESFKEYAVTDYYNKGWFTAVLNEDGTPKKDDQGNVVLDKEWNFETDVVHGAMTLYADFHKNPTLTIIVEGGDNIVVSKLPGNIYNKPTSSVNQPKRTGYTFIDYYTDNTYTEKFQFPYTFKEDSAATCYALMLEGRWEKVTDASSFRNALSLNRNMFFDVPSGEIDFSDPNRFTGYFEGYCNGKYDGTIYGNGCSLKNITLDLSYTKGKTTYSFFGNIGKAAVIKDLKIENLTFNFTVNTLASSDTKVALFATNVENGAQLNVEFKNCALNCKGAANFSVEVGNEQINSFYSSSGKNYDCFDAKELQVTNNMTVTTVTPNQ